MLQSSGRLHNYLHQFRHFSLQKNPEWFDILVSAYWEYYPLNECVFQKYSKVSGKMTEDPA